MAIVKVVHTSNVHLGRRFPNLESKGEELRTADVARVFSEMGKYAAENEADIILVAGDLFDKMNPGRETISSALAVFGAIHEKLPGARIVVSPGQDEIFVREGKKFETNLSIFDHLPFVSVIGAEEEPETLELEIRGEKILIASCGLDLFFRTGFKNKKLPSTKGMAGVFMLSTGQRRGNALHSDYDLLREKVLAPIRERGFQYAALGGRHELSVIETGEFTAIYPGSLERFDFDKDRERKCFVSFNIENGKIGAPETVRSQARRLEYINLTCSIFTDVADLEKTLSDLGRRDDKDKVLYIVLNGQLTFDQFEAFKNCERIKNLKQRFACVHIENRLILLDGKTDYNFDALRVNSPVEEFRRTVMQEMEDAKERGGEVRILQELLEMGIAEIEEGP